MTGKQLIQAEHSKAFISEISQLIHSSKQRMAVAVNAELTLLYWHIGKRINDYILQGERAEYGQEVVKNLAQSSNGAVWQRLEQTSFKLHYAVCSDFS